MQFEGPHQQTPTLEEEFEDAKKEMHMSGRAMRINETLEEYLAEREKSWDEKQAQSSRSPQSEPNKFEARTEYQLGKEHLFDDQSARQIVDIAQDWLNCGGNLYDHITGKSAKLIKGVDYKLNPDGTPDMASYREAMQKKVDEWLEDPSNQTWLDSGKQFDKSHKDEISNGTEKVSIRRLDGTIVEKDRYTTPYFYESGWLYYESNYFDKQSGEMRQPERETTEYRVYFDLEGQDIISTYQDMIELLNNDPDLQKLGFQMKTADVTQLSPHEIGQIMNQRDRVVLYLGKEGIEKALPLIQQYVDQHRQKFNRKGVLLAEPLTDSAGSEVPAVSVTSETKGRSPDPTQFSGEYKSFSDMQSMIIESSFRSIIDVLKKPDKLEALAVKYPAMTERLATLSENASMQDYLRKILADPQGKDFLATNLQIVYPHWARAFGKKEDNIAFKQN